MQLNWHFRKRILQNSPWHGAVQRKNEFGTNHKIIIIQETKAKKWQDDRYEKGGFDSIKKMESSGFGGCMYEV